MASYNRLILMGNLCRDVELKYLSSGTSVGSTSIAVNESWKDAKGDKREEVLFIEITFWGKLAEIANQYLSKGSSVLVEGRLRLEQWEKDGAKHSRHKMVVDKMQMLGGGGVKSPSGSGGASSQAGTTETASNEIHNEDIPF